MKKETRTFFIIVLIVLLLPFHINDEEHISEDAFVSSSPVIVSYFDTIHSPVRARAVIEVCAIFKTFAVLLLCTYVHEEVKSNVEFYGRKRIRVVVHRFHPD